MTLLRYDAEIARRPRSDFVFGAAQTGTGMVVVAVWLPGGSVSPVDQAAARNLEEASEGRAAVTTCLTLEYVVKYTMVTAQPQRTHERQSW